MSAKQDHYEDRLNPTAAEFVLLLLDELYDLACWVCSFSLTRTIARLLGRHFDPNGSRLPEWKIRDQAPFQVLANEYIHLEDDGQALAVYDGVVYRNARIIGGTEEEGLTGAEIIALQQYNPPLRSLTLARKVKRCMAEGNTDQEIAALANCSVSYARHYRLALTKANKQEPTSPLFDR